MCEAKDLWLSEMATVEFSRFVSTFEMLSESGSSQNIVVNGFYKEVLSMVEAA